MLSKKQYLFLISRENRDLFLCRCASEWVSLIFLASDTNKSHGGRMVTWWENRLVLTLRVRFWETRRQKQQRRGQMTSSFLTFAVLGCFIHVANQTCWQQIPTTHSRGGECRRASLTDAVSTLLVPHQDFAI